MVRRFFTMETLSATMAAFWGGFVLNPQIDTFKTVPKLFDPMEAIAPEGVWGAIYLVTGLVALLLHFLGWDGACTLLLVFAFASLSALFLMGDPQNLGFGIYGVVAFFNAARHQMYLWKCRQP